MNTLSAGPRPEVVPQHRQGAVIALDAVTTSDLAVVGGRAARLSRAIRAGLPVPDGVVLTSDSLGCLGAGTQCSATADHLDDVFMSLGRNGQMPLSVRLSAVSRRSSANAVEAASPITRRFDLLHTVRRLSVTATLLGDTVAAVIQHDVGTVESGALSLRALGRCDQRLRSIAKLAIEAFGEDCSLEWAIDTAQRVWVVDIIPTDLRFASQLDTLNA